MSYLEEYRRMNSPFGGKETITYEEFLYDTQRMELQQQWRRITFNHKLFGCPLEPTEDGTRSMVCVIHGTQNDRREIDFDTFMGSFKDARP
jgi:hypothetical protein